MPKIPRRVALERAVRRGSASSDASRISSSHCFSWSATGEGLEKQAEKIREWCKKKGIQLLTIHEDIASAVGDHSYKRRTGLQDAHKQALREHAILVASDPTRLFRNLTAAVDFLNNLPKKVFSIQPSIRGPLE
ncbi:recombinase family protein [Pacificibacter maritimus]|uniref:recombinase family protein n=1 Tax=Pacificibacter maritimus TaxID=762213 RepID=UPI0014746258